MISLKISLITIFFVAIALNHHCLAPSMEVDCNEVLSGHYECRANQGLYNAEKAFYEQSEKKINKIFPFDPNATAENEAIRQKNLGFMLGYFHALLDSLYDLLDLTPLLLEGDFCTKMSKDVREHSVRKIEELKKICGRHAAILLKNRDQYPVDRFTDNDLNLKWSTLTLLYVEWTENDISLENMPVAYDEWPEITNDTKTWYLIVFGMNLFDHYRLYISRLRPINRKMPDVKRYCSRYRT